MLSEDDNFFLKKGLCGIQNVGNTCFLNSIIQCLNSNRELFLIYKNNTNLKYSEFVKQWYILCSNLYHKNSLIKPVNFINELSRLLSIEKEYLNIGNQEDAHEILQFILEKLHEGLSKKVNIEIQGQIKTELDKKMYDSLKSWKLFFESDFSPILDLYYGQYISIVKNNKDEKSYTYDPFSVITLEICNGNNIYECLDNFTKTESIDNDIKKKMMFWKLPKHLIINFKRYNNYLQKNNKLIDYPKILDLNDYTLGPEKKKSKYELYAIANHSGNCSQGHYYSFIKNLDNNWYNFNDEIVSTYNSNLINSSAYCLFYKKI